MTVAELLTALAHLPSEAKIICVDSEYNGATKDVTGINYQEKPGWGRKANTVILR